MDIRIYGYMDIRIYECTDVWIYGCTDVQMYWYMYTCIRIYGHTDTRSPSCKMHYDGSTRKYYQKVTPQKNVRKSFEKNEKNLRSGKRVAHTNTWIFAGMLIRKMVERNIVSSSMSKWEFWGWDQMRFWTRILDPNWNLQWICRPQMGRSPES